MYTKEEVLDEVIAAIREYKGLDDSFEITGYSRLKEDLLFDDGEPENLRPHIHDRMGIEKFKGEDPHQRPFPDVLNDCKQVRRVRSETWYALKPEFRNES